MYHIFRVYDYKGGELSSNINLTEDEFISELIETIFNDLDAIDLKLTNDRLKNDLLSQIKPTTEYAGRDSSIVIECYKDTPNGLEFIEHEYFIKTNYELFLNKLRTYAES